MVVECGQQKGSLDAVRGSGPLRHRALQPVHRLVVFAESGVDVRKMIGRDVCASRSLFELPQYLPGLRDLPRHRISLPKLTEPESVGWRDRYRLLQFGQTFVPPSGETVRPSERGPRAIVIGIELYG